MLEKQDRAEKSHNEHDASMLVDDDREQDATELSVVGAASRATTNDASGQPDHGSGYDAVLQRKLVRYQRKMELDTFRLNTLHGAGASTVRVRKDLESSISALTELLMIADPAQLLNDVMHPTTSQARASYLQKLNAFETAVKAGRAKHGWNLVAGGVGNLLCFGIGGAASTLTTNPVVGLAVNTTVWTFAEPLISMMRATTFTNPYLDLYMVRQRLQARAAREGLDGSSGLERNRKFSWTNPDTETTEWLNAADWLSRTSWRTLWAGKHLSDDAPYHIYSAAYGASNCLPEFFSPALYNMATWRGKLTFIGMRTGAGFIAGATLQECVQLLRAGLASHTGGKEVVTKTTALWKDEAAYLDMLLQDIDKKRGRVGADPLEQQAYETLYRSVKLWHDKASAKSWLPTSVLYEWRAMVQRKRDAIGIDPEVPGKRLDTAASFLGKAASQLSGIGAGSFGAKAVKSPVPWIRWAGYLIPPLASIGAGGFHIRRELEVAARVMLGAAQGVARRCCGGHEAED